MSKVLLVHTAVTLTTENLIPAFNEDNEEQNSQETVSMESVSMVIEDKGQQDKDAVTEENNSEVMIYECLLCKLICNKKARLIRHVNVIHTHRSKHTVICHCRKCNLYFSILTEFKSHKCVALLFFT